MLLLNIIKFQLAFIQIIKNLKRFSDNYFENAIFDYILNGFGH